MPEPSVARRVREYLDAHPVFSDAIQLKIGNYSAIARKVAAELGVSATDAVLAACRRYPRSGEAFREVGVRRLLRRSRIETRTKVAAVTVSESLEVLQHLGDVVEELWDENSLCRLIQVSRGIVIILDEDSVLRVTRVLREGQLISVRKNLIEVAVTSPESIEDTPGLLRHLTGILATRGINIVEALSCYTDTIFLLDDDSLAPATEALTRALR